MLSTLIIEHHVSNIHTASNKVPYWEAPH